MALYVEIFSEYPFFEKFSEEVSDMLDSYSKSNSCLYCVTKENLLIGFGAGIPLKDCSADFKNIVKKHLNIEECYYNADVAVLKDYRNHGIGTNLIEMRIKEATERGFKFMVMRTAKKGSFSKSIYQKHEFSILNEIQLIKQNRIDKTIFDIDERIILWKKL